MLTVKRFRGNISDMDRKTRALLDAWLDGYGSANTRAAYRRDIDDFVAWCESTGRVPLEATAKDIDRYRDACLRGGASTATVARRLSGVASFFRHVGGDNPVEDVERPVADPPDDVLDTTEVDDLLGAAEALGTKAAALLSLLALDGMKLGDALALDVPRLHGRGPGMSVEVVRRGHAEDVDLERRTAVAIAAYVGSRRRGPMFLGDSATAREPSRLTRFGADFIIKKAASAAGIDRTVSANVLLRSHRTRDPR